jgi:hypothetical protein
MSSSGTPAQQTQKKLKGSKVDGAGEINQCPGGPSHLASAQQTQNKLKGSKVTGPGDARERWQVRPGNLVHDEEWKADYYNLRRRRNQFNRGRSSPL